MFLEGAQALPINFIKVEKKKKTPSPAHLIFHICKTQTEFLPGRRLSLVKYQSHVALLGRRWLQACSHGQNGIANYSQGFILKHKVQDFSIVNIKALL